MASSAFWASYKVRERDRDCDRDRDRDRDRDSRSPSWDVAKRGIKPVRSISMSSLQRSQTADNLQSIELIDPFPPGTTSVQKLYLLLPNHKCPNKKTCPFHPPEEEEEALTESEVAYRNKNKRRVRSRSLVPKEELTETLLKKKLAKINEQIANKLVASRSLHFPDKIRRNVPIQVERVTPPPFAEEEAVPDHSETTVIKESCIEEPRDVVDSSKKEEILCSPPQNDVGVPVEPVSSETSPPPVPEAEPVPSNTETVEFSSVETCEDHVKDESFVAQPQADSEVLIDGVLKEETPSREVSPVSTQTEDEVVLPLTGLSFVDAGTFPSQPKDDGGEKGVRSAKTMNGVKAKRKKQVQETAHKEMRPGHEYDTRLRDTNIPPEFTLPLTSQTRVAGEEVTFTVTVTCRPEPEVMWYHGKLKLTKSSRVFLEHHKGVYRLTILDVTIVDAGKYKCQAINAYGETWCTCILKVVDRSDRYKTIQ